MSQEENKYSQIIHYSGLAVQWMILLLLAVWAGMKLDKMTGWRIPLFLILLPVLALFFSIWRLIRELNKPKK